MKILTTYKCKIPHRVDHLDTTVTLYRQAVDFFIRIIQANWDAFDGLNTINAVRLAEVLSVETAKRPFVRYDFKKDFHRFPSYLRRAAISEAFGAVSSFMTRLALWQKAPKSKQPGLPKAGHTFPALYKDNMFIRTDRYTARIKLFNGKAWVWQEVRLRKTDVDYIAQYCASRKECSPTLRRRGKCWSLDFAFEENKDLREERPLDQRKVLGVDLGINNACVCVSMTSQGTVLGRKFFKLPREKALVERRLSEIKKAQRNGARKMPKRWALAKGANQQIAVKTGQFIVDEAIGQNVDVIVLEHLDVRGRKRGSKRQKLHHWRAMAVQEMVEQKAHRAGIRVRRVCARNTSRLAYDGSGVVKRNEDNYSLCEFTTGKRYHADLNAALNISARYFVREILKTLSVTVRQHILAKVPECASGITRTCSSLIRLNAELCLYQTKNSEFCPYGTQAAPESTNRGKHHS